MTGADLIITLKSDATDVSLSRSVDANARLSNAQMRMSYLGESNFNR